MAAGSCQQQTNSWHSVISPVSGARSRLAQRTTELPMLTVERVKNRIATSAPEAHLQRQRRPVAGLQIPFGTFIATRGKGGRPLRWLAIRSPEGQSMVRRGQGECFVKSNFRVVSRQKSSSNTALEVRVEVKANSPASRSKSRGKSQGGSLSEQSATHPDTRAHGPQCRSGKHMDCTQCQLSPPPVSYLATLSGGQRLAPEIL